VYNNDSILRNVLQVLMEDLEAVGAIHEELYDTEVRENMFEAVLRSFLKPEPGYVLPHDYSMFKEEGNLAIRNALGKYIDKASKRCIEMGLSDPIERLAAFQDGDVKTKSEGSYPDDFFGWAESI
jgi:hypothetical protein